ncbi:hypothetical protein J6590_074627 [Homalodisca vitripennis]|nr:hypothetical protein J6590_074627 [Homalodisca vitripennis]
MRVTSEPQVEQGWQVKGSLSKYALYGAVTTDVASFCYLSRGLNDGYGWVRGLLVERASELLLVHPRAAQQEAV